jgi:predicted glycosyltransferase
MSVTVSAMQSSPHALRAPTAPRYLLSSHDGFGLGHTRRNSLIAKALLAQDSSATVTLVTGLATNPHWLTHPRMRVVRVPSLVKNSDGRYVGESGQAPRAAVARRAAIFAEIVGTWQPDVVVVDRHPYGTFGELRHGLLRARLNGAALVLGLRDVLDESASVEAEVGGGAWAGVSEIYTDVLVYGSPVVCDHQAEYDLPVEPIYCGWVTETPPHTTSDPTHLIIAAGGGGDGRAVYELGCTLVADHPGWRATVLAGPFADEPGRTSDPRIDFVRNPSDTVRFLARAGGVIQMAGYNSTFEALAAGLRPILVPRRSPRREQAIRASRLASLGLADVVDQGSSASEVAWLLDRPRRLSSGACDLAGITLDGAERAAAHIASLCLAVA